MKHLYITLSLVLGFHLACAQQCGTDEYHRTYNNSSNRSKAPALLSGGRDTLPNEVIVIPVVVHVVYHNASQNIPDEQIHAQLDALNRDFRKKNADTVNTPLPFKHLAADARITFCLAQVDPQGYKTSGIVRKYTREPLFLADDQMKFSAKGGSDAWDPSRYLNIWVCDLFGRVLGYATAPGANPDVDGVVMQHSVFGFEKNVRAPFNKGRTLTHEVGHWLGLKHLWGDVDGGTCADDGIDDTPLQTAANTGCSNFPSLSSCSPNPWGDMFMNYMDFSDDACMNMFTHGQKNAMRSLFAAGGLRNSFLDSDVCDGSGVQEAPPAADEEGTIRVFPNPATTVLQVETRPDDIRNASPLALFDIQGRLLVRKVVTQRIESLPVTAYPDGLYILVIGEGQNRRLVKVLKGSATDKR